ncbi:hypothetical protein A2U01_0094690, partial [Trifolium medium]|nr:hypothetical protein [Trifolium medium]
HDGTRFIWSKSAYLLSKKTVVSCHDVIIAPRWQNPEAIVARCPAMGRDGKAQA